MKNAVAIVVAATAVFAVAAATAHAQKGVGDPAGVVRQAVTPEFVSLSGKIIEIRTAPCESPAGRSLTGTHLILETVEKEQLNLHLGPAEVVADTVAKLSAGQEIRAKAFRTAKMKEKHYVAQFLTFEKTTVELREGLRPLWAQNPVGPRAVAAGQAGLGRGRPSDWARGTGWGRGAGRGRGAGWGRGTGGGRGAGRGRGAGWGRSGQQWLAPPQRQPATFELRPGAPGRIAVTAVAPSLDAAIDPRFGRCRYLLLVDPEGETLEALENTDTTPGNAGVQAVEMIAAKGVRVLLTGECGPKASKALAAAGIEVVPGCSGTVRAAVKQFKAGQRRPTSKAEATPDSASVKPPAPGRRP